MDKKIVIIGAGGHGRVVADIAKLNKYTDILFLDDNCENKGCTVAGKVSDYIEYIRDYDFIVGIGDNKTRQTIMQKLINSNAKVVTLIHPKAVVCKDVKIGIGSVIMAGVVINTNVVIGNGVIINTSASVDHDCIIGNYVHISVGANIAGTVNIGNEVFVGAGATIINNLSIVGGCIIGAGAVVVEQIKDRGTYIGIPSKRL